MSAHSSQKTKKSLRLIKFKDLKKSMRARTNYPKQNVNRISMSLPPKLLIEFEKSMEKAGFTDRSKAIQAALHSFVDEHSWKSSNNDNNANSGIGVGVIILLYDNHIYGQDRKSVQIQHLYSDVISSATHVHLKDDNCLESIMVSGERKRIKELTKKLSENRGIKSIKVHFMSLF
jgi:CopG family transcriptional regulator, nickel-responsive regulator